MTKTGEQAAKEAPETAQVLRMADYKPKCWRQSSSGLMKCL